MVSEKLIAFILKARQNKRNDAQIIQQLLSVGWKQDSITEALSEIKSKKIVAPTAAQAAKMAQAQAAAQPAPTSPPWVKPADAQTAPVQPSTSQPAAPVTAQGAAPQAQAAASSAPQQPSSAPPEAAQTFQAPPSAPAQQAVSPQPQAQSTPAIPTPQTMPQSSIPPATPIQLPSEKKSLFSSLFGKKPSQPKQPAAGAQPASQAPAQPAASPLPPAAAPALPSAVPAAKPPIFPPRAPAQSTLPPPAASQPPVAQGQSTLATFAGASSQPSAGGTAPAAAQMQQPSVPQAPLQLAPTPSPAAPQSHPAAQAKPSAGIMKLLPIIGLVALIAIAAGAFYILVLAPASAQPPAPTQPIVPPVQNITPSNPAQQAADPADCGIDMDCFIQASSSCKPAKVVFNASGNLLGMIVISSTYMELENTSDAGKCQLYSSTLGASVKFNNSVVASALAKGVSIDEIQKQEAESTRQAQANIGLNGTCQFGAAELPAMLTRWNAGKFASSDYAGAECSGKRYANLQPGSTFLPNLTAPNFTSAAANASKANATAKANATSSNSTAAPANASKANTTAAASSTNASAAASNSTTAKTFNFYRKYTTYYPEHLAWFCPDRKSEFYRVHWTEYFGGDCNVPKPKDGFVDFAGYNATGCTMLPCCVNGPYNEYSRSYDYFECGYN